MILGNNYADRSVITVVEFHSEECEIRFMFPLQLTSYWGFIMFCKTFWLRAAKNNYFIDFFASYQGLKQIYHPKICFLITMLNSEHSPLWKTLPILLISKHGSFCYIALCLILTALDKTVLQGIKKTFRI